MKPSSLYGHLAELITAVGGSPAPADTLVRRYFRDRHYIGSKERRWLSTRIFGVIRHRRLLDDVTLPALRAGGADLSSLGPLGLGAAYALGFAGDTADEIADALTERWTIDASVPLPKEFLTTVGARLHDVFSAPVSAAGLALQHSFPDEPVLEWAGRLGLEETGKLLAALNTEAPLTVRVNTLQCTVHECAVRMKSEGIDTGPGILSPFALRLPARVRLESLGSYREGWFEVQDEGSQMLSMLLRPEQGSRIIDACAGAGGKTMHLGALMQNKGALIAIDPGAAKLKILQDRAVRAGVKLQEVITARHDDPVLDRLHGKGDGVLVDAPCSGLGTVRRNPWLKSARDAASGRARQALQRDILRRAALMVRPGGRLVYSTCTLRRAENEDVVEEFLRGNDQFALASASGILRGWGIEPQEESTYLTLWPHWTDTDGFFAAVMHRATGG
jgi:16S rRNA (cytosine967-C5)-methyltransferase